MEFQNPLILWALLPLAFLALFFYRWHYYKLESVIAVSSKKLISEKKSLKGKLYPYVYILRFLAIGCLIVALARPGHGIDYSSLKTDGIDIMVVLDLSDSMSGEDFQPKNRLEVAKQVVADFVQRRVNDRVGLVVFAGEPYLQCPLTLEHQLVVDILSELNFQTVEGDGTAIGDALTLAADRMKESKAKSKMILLITDGVNNRGTVTPEIASTLCGQLGIKIYTVGIGKNGKVPYTIGDGFFKQHVYMDNQFDEKMLTLLADKSGGKSYRATETGVFWDNIKDIDQLEKTSLEVKKYYEFSDKFQLFLIIAAALFLLEIFLKSFLFRKIP